MSDSQSLSFGDITTDKLHTDKWKAHICASLTGLNGLSKKKKTEDIELGCGGVYGIINGVWMWKWGVWMTTFYLSMNKILKKKNRYRSHTLHKEKPRKGTQKNNTPIYKAPRW